MCVIHGDYYITVEIHGGCEYRSKCMRLGDTEVIVANYQDFVGIIQILADILIFGSKIPNFCSLSVQVGEGRRYNGGLISEEAEGW